MQLSEIQKYLKSKRRKITPYIKQFEHSTLSQILFSYISVTIILVTQNLIFICIFTLLFLVVRRKVKIVLILSSILSVFVFFVFIDGINLETSQNFNKKVEIEAVVTEETKLGDFNQEVVLQANSLNISGKIIGKADKYPKLNIYDKVLVTGTLKEPKNLSDFDYKEYLKSRGIFYQLDGEVKLIERARGVDNFINEIRYNLVNIFKINLNEPGASITSGIMIGSESFGEEFDNKLRNSGLSHITSVSGYNFTIIYIFLLSFAGIINRKIIQITAIPILILYLFLVGTYNIPALRAVLMIILVIIGSLMGRKTSTINLLLLSAGILLIEYPLLLNNLSFQLSFGATIGLFTLSESFKKLINKYLNKFPEFAKEIIASTFAVLSLTTLITFGIFNSFPVTTLISNILVLPLIPIIMFLAFLGIIFSFLSISIIAKLIFASLELILSFVVKVIEITGSLTIDQTLGKVITLILITTLIFLIIRMDYIKFHNENI